MVIAVIGTGSTGVISICHLLNSIPNIKVVSINNPKIPSIGIGESTNPVFWGTVGKCLSLPSKNILHDNNLDATIKLGTYYKNWRNKGYLNPLFGGGDSAIHFDTFQLKDFVFSKIKKIYSNQFKEVLGNVKSLSPNGDLLINETHYKFDYIIDCRGFPEDNEDEYITFSMPTNHCLIHNIKEDISNNDWKYTLHQATEDGWMFGVPLKSRKSYGYLFNNKISSIEEAKFNFAKTINVDINFIENISYEYKSYNVREPLKNKLLKNGNIACFLEPMFANSLWLYDTLLNLFSQFLKGEISESNLNYSFNSTVKNTHDLICWYYSQGSIFNTPFWEYAKEYSNKTLSQSSMNHTLNDMYQFMDKTNTRIEIDHLIPFIEKDFRQTKHFFNNKI